MILEIVRFSQLLFFYPGVDILSHLLLWSTAFSELADAYDLLKLGGSDYHGSKQVESELGSANLPMLVVHEFLKVARPIWCTAIRDNLKS
jgi:hypothetical protein